MILLALETATEAVGAAVTDPSGTRAASWSTGRRRHAELLAPAVLHVAEQAGIELADLDMVAVDCGPGLFTGLRVGVAMANGLGTALRRPVVGVSSLEAVAHQASASGWEGDVLAVIDARRGETFVARYRAEPGQALSEVLAPGRVEPGGLAAVARPQGPGSPGAVLAAGDGARRYAGELAEVPGVRVAGWGLPGPGPEAVANVALARASEQGLPPPGTPVAPVYLRDPDVKVGWPRRGPP